MRMCSERERGEGGREGGREERERAGGKDGRRERETETKSISYITLCILPALASESYESHPGFTLPTDSYSLQLNKPHPQPQEFQKFADGLHSTLNQQSM